ncbi:MAG: hypothetical protein J6T91_00105 [Alphaproteobacteria bacterium]|nr:hypothetical protein [Alphaproteobacteria bacterium]
MKKLLLGAMLAAACITTNVDAGILGIRTKGDKAEVDTVLREYAGENYEEVSKNIINHTNDLKTAISTIKKDKNNKTILKTKIQIDSKKTKTATKILDDVQKESKKISEFFESMIKKNSRTNISKKGNNAKQAADALLNSLKTLKGSNSTWESFKDKLKASIIEIADELKPLAENATEGTYMTKKGKGIELNIKALLTSLSTSFESIRGLFADKVLDQSNSESSTVNLDNEKKEGVNNLSRSDSEKTLVNEHVEIPAQKPAPAPVQPIRVRG